MSATGPALPYEVDRKLAAAEGAASIYANYDRAQVAKIVDAVARVALAEAGPLARRAADETGFGVVQDKALKNESIARAFLEDHRDSDFCTHQVDQATRMLMIPRPAGVVFGITPSTSPVAALYFKVLCALITRNAIVVSPHPAARQVSIDTAELLAQAAERAGAPVGTIQVLEEPSIPLVEMVMADPRVKLVIATGGGGVVRAAYRSGTPAIGVGPGNAPVIIDETVELKQAVEKLVRSKTFDNGVLCTTESVLIAVEEIVPRLLKLLESQGVYLCSSDETQRIRDHVYPEGRFNTSVVGRPATEIAEGAGVRVPPSTRVLLTPIETVSGEEPLTHEKLSPVLAFVVAPDFDAALSAARGILDIAGVGHSAVIHSDDAQRVLDVSYALPVHRIAVNAPGSLGNAGFGTNLPISMSLGTGYIGGSSSSENLNPDYFVQWSRVAYPATIFDRFPDFADLVRSDRSRESVVQFAPRGAGDLLREELRRIVLEELRDVIGVR